MSGDPRSPEQDTAHRAFLDGDRPGDVLVYLPDRTVSDPARLAEHGRHTGEGTVLVVPGERGRAVLRRAVGVDPMALARRAADTDGSVAPDCTGGTCPDGPGAPVEDHRVRLVFAFAEPRNEAAGGPYAEGDVVHAYAACECGTAYSDRRIVRDP